MENLQVPDSQALEIQELAAYDTPECDNPAYGSVSLRMRQTSYSSTVLRMSRLTARKLRDELNEYLGE